MISQSFLCKPIFLLPTPFLEYLGDKVPLSHIPPPDQNYPLSLKNQDRLSYPRLGFC